MSRLLGWTAALALLTSVAATASAQPGRFELGGGVGFIESDRLTDGYAGGWLLDGGWRFAPGLTAIVEGSRHRLTQDVGFFDTQVTYDTIAAGIRLRFGRDGLVPYVQILGGSSRIAISSRMTTPVVAVGEDSAVHTALQLGGGLETPLGGPATLRVGLDYRRVLADVTLDQLRFSTAVVFR